MLGLVVQVAEDSNTNLLHLITEVGDGKSTNATAFVQTGNGCEPFTSGNKHLKGNVTHKYSGSYTGSKEDYGRAVHAHGKVGMGNEQILRSSGVKNLKRGTGAVIAATTVAATAYSAVQVGYLWDTFSADGVISSEELTRLALEASECLQNPVGSAVSELARSALDPDHNAISIAEVPGVKDTVAEGISGFLGSLFS